MIDEIMTWVIKGIVVVLVMVGLDKLHQAIYGNDMTNMMLIITAMLAWSIIES